MGTQRQSETAGTGVMVDLQPQVPDSYRRSARRAGLEVGMELHAAAQTATDGGLSPEGAAWLAAVEEDDRRAARAVGENQAILRAVRDRLDLPERSRDGSWVNLVRSAMVNEARAAAWSYLSREETAGLSGT